MDMLLLCGLASWRLAYMLVRERGVFGIASWLRDRAGVREEQIEHQVGQSTFQMTECAADREIGKALCCIYCTGVWVSLFVILLYHTEARPVVYVLAVAGVVVILEKVNQYF